MTMRATGTLPAATNFMKRKSAVLAAAVGHDEFAAAGRECRLVHFNLLDFDNIIMTEKHRKVKPESKSRPGSKAGCNIMKQAAKIQHRRQFYAGKDPGKQGML